MNRDEITYQDMIGLFGSDYEMPPAAHFEEEVEFEYRCPYHSKCPTGAHCFVVSTPVPLQDTDILNVRCRYCGNSKIPVYAKLAAKIVKK